MPLHAPDQIQILKQRERAASAHSFVTRPPDENARITIAQSEPSKVGINGGHLPRGIVFTLKNQPEVTADHGTVAQGVSDRFERSGFRTAVGVHKPQDIAPCLSRRGSNLVAATALGRHNANSQFHRNGGRAVFTASVGDQNLLLTRQRLQCSDGFGNSCLFVQRWHNNAYQCHSKVLRMKVVNAPCPSHYIC